MLLLLSLNWLLLLLLLSLSVHKGLRLLCLYVCGGVVGSASDVKIEIADLCQDGRLVCDFDRLPADL